MSSTPIEGTASSDDLRRWDALDSQYERLVDASDRLLIEFDLPAQSDRADVADQGLRAAS